MKSDFRKMIAPIVVALVMMIYFIVYFSVIVFYVDGILKYLLAVLPLGFAILAIKTCIERIKEIRSEDDDISNY